jgi:hypothetical protein
MGGGNFIQTGQFGSKPVDMGGFADFGDFERGQQNPNMTYGQPFMGQPFMGGESPTPSFGLPPRDLGFNSVQPGMGGEGFDQRQLTPDMMANMQQAAQAAAQQGQRPMGLGQAAQTGALTQSQTAGLGGLAALLGGKPTSPTPAVSAPPPPPPAAPVAAKPAPVAAKRAPVAAKPVAKPSAVPPKTPPAVASAIQKLAAKKKPFGRR